MVKTVGIIGKSDPVVQTWDYGKAPPTKSNMTTHTSQGRARPVSLQRNAFSGTHLQAPSG